MARKRPLKLGLADKRAALPPVSRVVNLFSRRLTPGDSYVYVASAITNLGRHGLAGTAAYFAQAGHVDHFATRHVESGRRDCGICLTRHRMSVMVESVLMPYSSFHFHPISALMAFILQPWQLFVTILAALINHYQQQVNDFQRCCPPRHFAVFCASSRHSKSAPADKWDIGRFSVRGHGSST